MLVSESGFLLIGRFIEYCHSRYTRSFVHTDHPLSELLGIAVVSFCCCLLQFALGRYIGKRKGYAVSTTQALGQKKYGFCYMVGLYILQSRDIIGRRIL